jgi:hypothetical protein
MTGYGQTGSAIRTTCAHVITPLATTSQHTEAQAKLYARMNSQHWSVPAAGTAADAFRTRFHECYHSLPDNRQGLKLPGLTNEIALAPSQWLDPTPAQELFWKKLQEIAHEAVAHGLAMVYRSLGDGLSFHLDLLRPQLQPKHLLKSETEELVKRATIDCVKRSPGLGKMSIKHAIPNVLHVKINNTSSMLTLMCTLCHALLKSNGKVNSQRLSSNRTQCPPRANDGLEGLMFCNYM